MKFPKKKKPLRFILCVKIIKFMLAESKIIISTLQCVFSCLETLVIPDEFNFQL